MVLTAHHVRDAHGGIIDRIAEEEGRGAIRAAHDEIPDVVAQETLRPVHEVHEFDPLARRHPEAQGRSEPRGAFRGALRGGQMAAGARIPGRPAGGQLGFAGTSSSSGVQ